jgi:hypothetical protein
LPGGEAFSDELDPLLSLRASCEMREGDSIGVGVLGLHPGCGTPITHIGSGHSSGRASESSSCLTPSTARCRAALRKVAAADADLRWGEEFEGPSEGDRGMDAVDVEGRR